MKKKWWLLPLPLAAGLAIIPLYHVPATVVIPQTQAVQFVRELKIGWNLGGALDACLPEVYGLDTETCWEEPRTTPEMFRLVKEAGYPTVRIPVTWGNHMGPGPDYIIEPAWMDRVQEVVDYAYDIGLYVILNTHNEDRYWHIPDRAHEEAVSAQMAALWAQAAARFKDYDERLLFESMNEPRVPGSLLEWAGGGFSNRRILNRLGEEFVRLVRASGGNNGSRYLVIPTHAAARDWVARKGMRVPEDERVIVSIHAYYPRGFSGTDFEARTWGSKADYRNLERMLYGIYRDFVRRGVPVLLGEFGAVNKHNLEDRLAYTDFYVRTARKFGMTCCWWDGGKLDGEEENGYYYGLLDRRELRWGFPALVEAMIGAAQDA